MTVSRSEVLPFAGRAIDAEDRVEPGLLCLLARVYGCADSLAALVEAVRAERRAGGMFGGLSDFGRCCGRLIAREAAGVANESRQTFSSNHSIALSRHVKQFTRTCMITRSFSLECVQAPPTHFALHSKACEQRNLTYPLPPRTPAAVGAAGG